MIGGLEIAASYGPKSALVLGKPAHKHGSEAADRLVMTSAEQCSDLDQETARIRASGCVLRELDQETARLMQALPSATEDPMPPRTKATAYHRQGNDPYFDLRSELYRMVSI